MPHLLRKAALLHRMQTATPEERIRLKAESDARNVALAAQRAEAQAQQLAVEKVRRAELWLADNRPSLFANCDIEGAPRPTQFKAALDYFTDGAIEERQRSGRGAMHSLVLHSAESGTGKTTCGWALIEKAVRESSHWPIHATPTVTFMRLCKARHINGEARNEFAAAFDACMGAGLLLLDDLTTEKKLSESSEEVLVELVDRRTSEELPTIITSNVDSKALRSTFSSRNGPKIMRRFHEFFGWIDFSQP